MVAFRAESKDESKCQELIEAREGANVSITPVQPPKEQQMFSGIQSVAEQLVNGRLNSVGKAPRVEFHKEPSRHFWIYRPEHPKLRLDVQLADDLSLFVSPRVQLPTAVWIFGRLLVVKFSCLNALI